MNIDHDDFTDRRIQKGTVARRGSIPLSAIPVPEEG
jgi:hypothetical protein